MNSFEKEFILFEEIKVKFKPIKGYRLLLDLDAYKCGETILTKFELDAENYHQIVNIEYNEKEKEKVIITANNKNTIYYESKLLRICYDYDKNEITELEDLTLNPYQLKRSLTQQIELLVFDLNNPKPQKPAC
jgi:hypothetical protein